MKTRLFCSAISVFLTLFTFAQDTICKTNGSKLVAKVTEINSSSIKYKFMNNGSELVAEASKSEIAYIAYAGGSKEIYNPIKLQKDGATIAPETVDTKPTAAMKNIVAINCFEMFFTNFSMSYERIFHQGKFSFKIPFSIGLGGKPNQNTYRSAFGDTHYLQNRVYSGGLEFNIYPFGQTRSTFYLGLSGVAGSFNYYENTYVGAPYYYPPTYIKHYGAHYAGMLHIGGYLGLSDNILLGAKFGIGYKREETIYEDYTIPKVQFDFNLAYRF